MLMGNCSDEKMVVISSTTNEWPQNNLPTDDPKSLNNNNNNNMASSTARIMEKPGQDQLQQQQQALKCPRCDSSNTKFCYYNNYSLSQPRHFCKACKRYWTRGGTLRNVPVGGGCRKNKRVKRPNSSSSSSSVADHHHHHHHNNNLGASNNSSSSSSPNSLLHGNIPSSLSSSALQPGQIDLSTAPNHHLSPLFYGLANNINSTIPSDISLPFSSRFGSTASGFDLLQPQLNSLGLGFSSGNNSTILSSTTTTDHHNNYNQNGFSSNSSLLSSYSSIFSSPSSASASPTIASLLASKFTNGGGTAGLKDHTFVLSARGSNHNFPSLLSSPFEELQITGNNGEPGTAGLMKHVKLEDGQRRLDWDGGVHNCSAQNDHQTVEQNIGLSSSSSDPSNSLNYWSNPTAVGGANWLDPGNIGSSVPSLI